MIAFIFRSIICELKMQIDLKLDLIIKNVLIFKFLTISNYFGLI